MRNPLDFSDFDPAFSGGLTEEGYLSDHEEDAKILKRLNNADWVDRFRDIGNYLWNNPRTAGRCGSMRSLRCVPLTQGFFMIVSPRDYKRMTQYPDGSPKKWHVKVERKRGKITQVYGTRRGRGGEPKTVFAHREVLGCIFEPGVGDHINGWGLDNRSGNLRYVSYGLNGHNSVRERKIHHGLPRGVEPAGKGRKQFRGIRCTRKNGKTTTIRSEIFNTAAEAALWYQKQLEQLHDTDAWSHKPRSVTYPVFPPRERVREDLLAFLDVPF